MPAIDNATFRFPRVRVGHAQVDCCSLQEAVEAITNRVAAGGAPACVVTPNAQHIVLLESDAAFREAYARADLVVADGASLLLASRLAGETLRARVAGVDLFEQLCAKAAELGLRVFLLGGRVGSADLAAVALKRKFPWLIVVGTCCPSLGFESDEKELRAVNEAIRAARPDLVFVALGAPKQECWMEHHGRQTGAPVLIGVGGSFEIVGGILKRAPGWIQRIGCEWLYRLLLEPRRLWKRYLVGNAELLWIVLRQLAGNSSYQPNPTKQTASDTSLRLAPTKFEN